MTPQQKANLNAVMYIIAMYFLFGLLEAVARRDPEKTLHDIDHALEWLRSAINRAVALLMAPFSSIGRKEAA